MTNIVRMQFTPCAKRAWVPLLVALAALWSAGTCQAAVRLESSGPPFYARISADEIYTDGVWAVIAFYRNPGCVPPAFNLLDFFDVPAAFGCASCVAGFEIWKNGPLAGDTAPIQSRLQNTAPMPIWFVAWSELQRAIADGVLTIDELAGLSSRLIGTAKFYTETLHPSGGEAQQTMISIVTSGVLADGRKFSFQATGTRNPLVHVRIEFK